MKPRSIITVTAQSLPMVLKYQDKEYLVKSTASGSLHMGKINTTQDEIRELEIDPNPAQVDLSPSGMAKALEDGDQTMGF